MIAIAAFLSMHLMFLTGFVLGRHIERVEWNKVIKRYGWDKYANRKL